ncbi:MAG: hypothetical protein OHK0039_34810 [Bacteroidia bacterium]
MAGTGDPGIPPRKTPMDSIIQPWITAGYRRFALEGPTGLKVEVLARDVHKSKSSFYHHFADLEVFTSLLLDHHLAQTRIIATRERQCKTLVPELLHLLLEYKIDLFFSRQLRIHRNLPTYKACFVRANEEIGDAFLDVWAGAIGLEGKTALARHVLSLVLENFYLQLTPETLSYEWLLTYFADIRHLVDGLKHSAR